MRLDEARNLRDELLSVSYTKSPTKFSDRRIGPVLIKNISKMHRVKYWNNISIGYSFFGEGDNEVRLELRAAPSSKGFDLAKRIKNELKNDANLQIIKRPVINLSISCPCGELQKKQDELCLGLSIGSHDGGTGTIGGFGTDLENSEINLISCYHVIGASPGERNAEKGASIYHPGPDDKSPTVANFVAELTNYPVLGERWKNKSDSACAKVLDGIECRGNYIPEGYNLPFEGRQIHLLTSDELLPKVKKVYKIGKTTGITEGRITAYSIDRFTLAFKTEQKKIKNFLFNNILEISWLDDVLFADTGDSGGCVFTEIDDKLYAIGMVFANGHAKGVDEKEYHKVTYACMMKNVLSDNGLEWLLES
jgi:hypothetical protein